MNRFKNLIIMLSIMICTPLMAKPFTTQQWTTKNGVRVVFYQAMEVPMLDMSIAFAAGSAYDKQFYGLSALSAQMLNEGSSGLSATTVAEHLADTGAQFDISNNRDMAVFSLRTLSSIEPFTKATDIFAQIINHPDFPNDALERDKKQMLMAIDQIDESPDEVANLNFFQTLYAHHPYGHPTNGTQSTVTQLTKQQVIDFYKQYYVASNAVLVMVGAISSETAHQLADKITRELPQGVPAAAIPKALPLAHSEQINIPFPSSQTIVRMGQLGIDHHNPNYFPLMVGNYILGGGALVSQLAIEVREKRGLTYGVSSQFGPMSGKGPFIISLSTKSSQTKEALKITDEVLRHFVSEGPTKDELNAAKSYLTGSFPVSLSGNKTIADLLLRIEFYHLPKDYLDTYVDRIKSVTSEEIKRAFQAQVNPDKLLLITVGKL